MTDSVPATVRAWIDHHAAADGERPFLFSPDLGRTLSYGKLKAGVDDIGARLTALGTRPGDKIGFLMDNGLWAAQLFLGVMASGRTIVPLNAVAGFNQLRHVLEHSDTTVVFVAPHYEEKLAGLLAEVERPVRVIPTPDSSGPDWPADLDLDGSDIAPPDETDTALLLYTSGSTGLPKGAMLSHRAVISGGRNVMDGHGLTRDDRALCVLPIYHINGAMVTVSAPLVSGGSVVMPGKFSASAFWPLVSSYHCTWSSVVPTIIKFLLDRADRETFDFGDDALLSAFRFARSASAPLPRVVLKQWEETFHVPMVETLGLTETAGTVATNPMPPAVRKPGSVGLARGNEIAIFNETGDPVAANTRGEIVIRGSNVLDRYYKNPEATEGAFFNDWFRTGDIGFLDDEDYLFITGRLKELIIRGGENIAPREIDDVLYRHEAILEAAAVGVDDENYGQEVVACVAVREGFQCSEAELQDFCRGAIGDVKTPKTIYFLDELPKGPSGKILRLELPRIIASLD